jgi:hypothetical protein
MLRAQLSDIARRATPAIATIALYVVALAAVALAGAYLTDLLTR